ncbi:MAG: DUF4147 domain-containing protein [Lachnospiraceae bacterium]|nr:DUF4147 domain-containing protein [Lachnospiraceae bacterium]
MRIRNREQLLSHGYTKGRKHMLEILEAGLQAADPYYNTRDIFRVEENLLYIGSEEFQADGDPKPGAEAVDLRKIQHIYVVGAAKGIQRMAKAIEDVLGEMVTDGHVIGKYGDSTDLNRIGITLAAHPTPDENCLEGCRKIVEIAEKVTENDLVITIIGNGGSSLLTYPSEGISIQEVKNFTHMMQIEKGVPTIELNVIRNHIDRLKGGRLTRLFSKAKVICLDCVDANDFRMRGVHENWDILMHENRWLHNLPDETTFADAMEIIHKYEVEDRTPDSIMKHLKKAAPEDETVHFEEFMTFDTRMFGITPASRDFMEAGKKKAEELGYRALTFAHVEAVQSTQAARIFSSVIKHSLEMGEPFQAPVALFIGEEMVVEVGDSKGVGGRNQEYALMMATLIDGLDKVTVGAVDTDGTDGPGGLKLEGAPNCLAGGIVDGTTMRYAAESRIDVKKALLSHSTSEALWRLDCGISATQNVSMGDLGVILIDS